MRKIDISFFNTAMQSLLQNYNFIACNLFYEPKNKYERCRARGKFRVYLVRRMTKSSFLKKINTYYEI